MKRSLLAVVSVVALTLPAVRPASAAFHIMQIEQVIGSVDGNTGVQAIQLRMRAVGQNLVSNARLIVHDAQGLNPVLVLDMTSNVTASAAGSRVLIATSNFSTFTNPPLTPDFIIANLIPPSYLLAGSLTFEDDFGTIYWRLSWGGADYTGTGVGNITNDADGNFNPPFPGPLQSGGGRALLFTGAATALSSNNAADYVRTSGPATFTRNDGASALIKSAVDVGDEFARAGVALSRPIPNPARSAVTYAVTLPRAAHVRIRAFDLRGRMVSTLVDREFPAGRQGLTWDVTNDDPGLASGVYLLVLEADGQRRVQRMVYLRGAPPADTD